MQRLERYTLRYATQTFQTLCDTPASRAKVSQIKFWLTQPAPRLFSALKIISARVPCVCVFADSARAAVVRLIFFLDTFERQQTHKRKKYDTSIAL